MNRRSMENGAYHYTESGLDNVYLIGGYEYADGGKTVIIRDIDALQKVIARALVHHRARLSGKEFRFLRTELFLSQASIAKILGVKELTVGRWERGQTEIPVAADAAVRMMFLESLKEKEKMKDLLERIADLEDEIDQRTLTLKKSCGKWVALENAPAAA